ncbi:hypothetical protein GCM10011380_24390 [Sphingomonas metalli]|uniref:DUF2336 domain-containing protein n=1 Tax=Sphingomonas metalli TaxID=1779358 RepID=A0A916T8P1_9SPHN|nr:hypothetical protein [Sphingomonas metalli]GGB34090.1 hypothetical protein GCM10011380_24390 [Sphingomonas metalli]
MAAQQLWDDLGGWAPEALAARVAGADRRAREAHAAALADLALHDADRLDDRIRAGLTNQSRALVTGIEASLRRHTLRLLADQMTAARAEHLLRPAEAVPGRLAAAGLLRDPALVAELVARIRQDIVASALPPSPGGPDEPSLLVRLSLAPDAPVARTAAVLLAAESRRRDQFERSEADGAELPADLYARLVWWVAAAMRGEAHDPARDRALAEAATRSLGAHEDGERSDALALRLVAAIDPRPAEIASLLVEAMGDRRLGVFIAILSHTLHLPFDEARALTLEPDGERLWLALRALRLDRGAIARIGLALAEADPRRDVERFADDLDAIVDVPPDAAIAALEPLTLDPRFLAAMRAFDRPLP